ncbi:unnamed protein product [Dracunculus medinensis]|uniref:7TM_GPCR_Srx domain-containing protein n=1 Tax=Dracunculus medinensis TaxID=318479 RepID=A0A0N4UQ71_DRAME|nr:unnamed protein product [Dracunculus medinensis]
MKLTGRTIFKTLSMCEKPKQLDTSSAWEFCPLSCYRLLLIISGLLTYSLIYLIYAQHHALLLYFMTGFILILFKNIILRKASLEKNFNNGSFNNETSK